MVAAGCASPRRNPPRAPRVPARPARPRRPAGRAVRSSPGNRVAFVSARCGRWPLAPPALPLDVGPPGLRATISGVRSGSGRTPARALTRGLSAQPSVGKRPGAPCGPALPRPAGRELAMVKEDRGRGRGAGRRASSGQHSTSTSLGKNERDWKLDWANAPEADAGRRGRRWSREWRLLGECRGTQGGCDLFRPSW